MITHNHLIPPAFVKINGQRYIVPGWQLVDDTVTLDDIKHVNPMANLIKRSWDIPSSRGGTYKVTRYGSRYTCECTAGRFGRKCRHVTEAKEKEK